MKRKFAQYFSGCIVNITLNNNLTSLDFKCHEYKWIDFLFCTNIFVFNILALFIIELILVSLPKILNHSLRKNKEAD